jgi:hypothetical protein
LRRVGVVAIVALAAAAIPLAAPGEALVPGAHGAGWVLGPYGSGLGIGGSGYFALLCVAFVAYLALLATAAALPPRLIWTAIVALVALFTLAAPLHSLDVFSYIAYARLGAEHALNPYEFAPAALPHDPAASRVEDFRFATSVYGPLFTLGTYPLGLVGVPAALWALKSLAGLSVIAIAAIVGRVACVRGVRPSTAAALVALNPLVLVHVVGGAHNDALMMLLGIAAGAAVVAGREALGGAALVAAAAIKASAALIAPFALLGARRPRRMLAAIALACAAVVAVTLPLFGSSAFDAFVHIGGNQDRPSHYGIPATLARLTGLGTDPIRVALLVAYAALLAALLVWTARGGDWLRAAGWATLGLLVASAALTPWYLVWALPLAAVGRDRVLVGAVLALSAYQLPSALPI